MRTRTILLGAFVAACGGHSSAKAPVTSPTSAASADPGTAKPATATPRACPAAPASALKIIPQDSVPTQDAMPSRDGRMFATQPTSREIHMFSVASGNKVAIIASKTAITKWSIRPDGRALATVADGKVSLKDLEKGGADQPGLGTAIALPGADVERLEWTSDARTLIVARSAQTDFVDAKTAAVTSSVSAGAAVGGISNDGRFVLARDGQLWDVKANRAKWKTASVPSAVAFSDSGDFVGAATSDRQITVFDTNTGTKKFDAMTSGRRSGDISIGADGKSLVTYDDGEYKYNTGQQVDQGVAIWSKGKRVRVPKANELMGPRAAFSPDGKFIALVGGGRYGYGVDIVILNAATGARAGSGMAAGSDSYEPLRRDQPPRWLSDGKTVAIASPNGTVMFDTQTKTKKVIGRGVRTQATLGGNYVTDAVFSPDDSSLLVLSEGGSAWKATASIVDLKTGVIVRALDAKVGAKSPIGRRFRTAQWVPDAGFVALTRTDGIVLWDGKSEGPMRVIDAGPESDDRMMSVSGKGNLVAVSVGQAKEARLYDTKTGSLNNTITLDEGSVEQLSFSPDGTKLAIANLVVAMTTGEQSALVHLYETPSGKLARTLHAKAQQVYFSRPYTELHWTPAGKGIVTVDGQGGIDLWNSAVDDPPQSIVDRLSQGGPSALVDNGNFMVVATAQGVEQWDLRTGAKAHEWATDGTTLQHVRGTKGGTVAAVSRGDHVDLYRLADGAHLVMRMTPAGAAWSTDNGTYAGPRDSLDRLRVRDGDLEVRPLRPQEIAALARPSLAADFIAGCAID